ncbi:MAG: hypothetical protein KatS3mg011_0411 [Acidimicrobiia bacterium]|nr:MAG: hypothetical protein KatS3mg011_0411 [Acidimicrobiia bacterium]
MALDTGIAWAAAVAASLFTLDLARDLARRPRPHVAAYLAGIAMFAAATWGLVVGLTWGWSGAAYRVFYLFGAVLNIPYLALGSMFLVGGRRAGHVMHLLVTALAAISVTLVTTTPFASPPDTWSRLPHDVFPPISEGFGPRLLAAISGGVSTLILVVLALVSLVRFWRKDRRVVVGNALILGGTLAAASGGTGLAVGGSESAGFALSLAVAATLLWLGYRTARGARRAAT